MNEPILPPPTDEEVDSWVLQSLETEGIKEPEEVTMTPSPVAENNSCR